MTQAQRLKTAALLAPLLLGACGKRPAADAGSAIGLSGREKVEAIASTLQACSYDGRPVTGEAAAFAGAAPENCQLAVKKIMDYTGLPANFVVTAGPVDNAAALIMLDQNRVPRRVIAFNPNFMQAAMAKVGGDPWGPTSILAHEIAHHLSGHTITPGGSRPEIELEADKFSGFVMEKMGAPKSAATEMILAVGAAHGSPTHPDKLTRANAIREGWQEACQQQGGRECGSGTGAVPVHPTADGAAGGSSSTSPINATFTLPAPGSIPFKYGRFIIDETGKLDPVRARAMDQKLYTLAKDVGAEFTILVVNDLRGRSAEDYAWAMMRQLRVGKLDVGNGAVVVVAPRQRQAAVAFGPGFAKEAEFSNPNKMLLEWIDAGWRYCDDGDGCQGWTDNLFNIFSFTLGNVARTKWAINYQSLGQLITHYDQVGAERARTHRAWSDAVDQPLGELLRISGKVTSLNPPQGMGQVTPAIVNGPLAYRAVSMTTDDGYPVILYIRPQTAGLMPSGAIREGQRYTLVGRLQRRGDKGQQASALWTFSYDAI
ncbi:TPM domain-containing protein [Sphingomonas crusticola]|uniref:TPM domain-containing protein n=1 Tax=Sphingomonas crusticola TaxID=1697973 RepID=UPI0019686D1D|nr:TPM domain-containing protein [Sphingomonas crusticola]